MSNTLNRLKFFLKSVFFVKYAANESRPNLLYIGEGVSLYNFISKHCLGETSGISHNFACHRLCSLMRKMDVRTAIIENISLGSDTKITEECNALNTYFGQQLEFIVYRITFLSERISSLVSLAFVKDNCFLSSSIVINYRDPKNRWHSYLFTSIVTIPQIKNHPKKGNIPLLNNYLHNYRTYRREICISTNHKFKYNITGTFFCQQNSITSVCSHAALCMIINNMDLPFGIITPEDINKKIKVDHKTNKFGPDKNVSFTQQEIKEVLREYKLTYELLDFFNNPEMEYNHFIYNYIESRCPVLLSFTTNERTGHVIPILGHTLNTDMWRPEAEAEYSPMSRKDYFKSASAWVDHFIINDDNFGMYLCLPVDTLKRLTTPQDDPHFRALYAIAIIPADVTTYTREAEWASSILIIDILRWCQNQKLSFDIWIQRLLNQIDKAKPIVKRTFLVTKKDYIESLEEKDFENNYFSPDDKRALTENLPERFWLSEISLTHLYTANKTKIMDFVYKCDSPKLKNYIEIDERWIQVRLPRLLIRRGQDGKPFYVRMSVSSHYPLLRFAGEHDTMDW